MEMKTKKDLLFLLINYNELAAPITILIDSGSTHNFLDPVVAKRTGCTIHHISPLMVTVVNGTKIASTGICKQLQWNIQGKEFLGNMRFIPLEGRDMVLGIQWLSELGPILWDFKRLWMEFRIDGKRHMMTGATTRPIKLISSDHMDKALKQSTPTTVAKLFLIRVNDSLMEKEQDMQMINLSYKNYCSSMMKFFLSLKAFLHQEHVISNSSQARNCTT